MRHGQVVSTQAIATKCVAEDWLVALADGGSAWKAAFAKAKEVTSQMTTEEKGK
jgi:hypothetical protein